MTRERLEEIRRGPWSDQRAFAEMLNALSEILPVDFGEPLSKKDLQTYYPALSTLLGSDMVQVDRVTGHGRTNAHMIFAPTVEHVLQEQIQAKLWDQFTFMVKLSRRRKKCHPTPRPG